MARHGSTIRHLQDRAVSIAQTLPAGHQEAPDDQDDKGDSKGKVEDVKGLHGAFWGC